ncbi:L,D-transpeptidase family protein [Mediterraneibacter agrestimuris]|uniref:L,D-transpeptidase family protein n=1 Tax=Mediterraneibacter agrestimuris TaxID=2941333 RepID=UPI00203A6B8F|nr:L,D-transpeptidase family protein [Mediterraneibacter agrestimuris]
MSKREKIRKNKIKPERQFEEVIYLDDDYDSEEEYLDEEYDSEEEDVNEEYDSEEEDADEEYDSEEEDADEEYDSEEDYLDEVYDSEEKDSDEEYDSEEEYLDGDYDSEGEEVDDIPKNKNGWKKAAIIAGSILGVFAAVYIGVSVFFMSHFYINTEINGHKFSGKSASDVENYMKEQVKGYTLTIQEKDNKTDKIVGSDISLRYKENSDIENALKNQNAFLWPIAFFVENSTEVTIDVGYDEAALNEKIENLQAVNAEQIPATNAYPRYDGMQYVVEPEVLGTAVEKDVLRKKIHEYISGFKPELDMEEEGCYALPKYTADSAEVKKACDDMNQYLRASITYTMDENVVVDKELISTWLTADENMQVTFNENGVREWLTQFGDRYDTMGGTREITSPWGKTTTVSGGDYGWSIDEDTEFIALTNSIKNGEVVTKEPAYYNGGIAASHGPQDWGSTYLEVDLSAQHMWFIVDGAVAMETDVVTGVPIPARETVPGVWFVKEMQQNKTLVGETDPETGEPEYETPVAYWMRITWSGIGFHDATWQPAFGGTLYADGLGSHGCINMPYDQAALLYSMLPMGTPAVVHY